MELDVGRDPLGRLETPLGLRNDERQRKQNDFSYHERHHKGMKVQRLDLQRLDRSRVHGRQVGRRIVEDCVVDCWILRRNRRGY